MPKCEYLSTAPDWDCMSTVETVTPQCWWENFFDGWKCIFIYGDKSYCGRYQEREACIYQEPPDIEICPSSCCNPEPSPPPSCVYNCGDKDCCEEDGENSSNCSQDCGGSGTECWYCQAGFSCVFGNPGGNPCGCSDCLFGTVGGLVFWDKNENGSWDGDGTDARVITSEANRCNDSGEPDVVISDLKIVSGGNFGGAIDVDSTCNALNDDRPSCATRHCADSGTSNGRCWCDSVIHCIPGFGGDPGSCPNPNPGCWCDNQWSWCGVGISQSCFSQCYVDCDSDTPSCGAWAGAGYTSLLSGRIFTKNIRVGTYQLSLAGLPAEWSLDTVNAQTTVQASNPTPTAQVAFFPLQRRVGIISGKIYDGCACNGSANSPGGWSVSLSGTSYSCNDDSCRSIVGNDYSFTDVPYGSYTVTLTPPADWNVVCGASKIGTLGASSLVMDDFFLCEDQDAWWQTSGGSVHSDGDLNSDIPSSATDPYLMLGTHGVLSYGEDSGENYDLGNGGISSGNNWSASSDYAGVQYGYDWWSRHLRNQARETSYVGGSLSDPGSSTLYETSGGTISMEGGISSGSKIVVLHEGDLNINGDISVASGGFLMVIVDGSITVNDDVDNVQGIFIADVIDFATAGSEDDAQLDAQGTFVGWTDVNIERNIGGAASALNPSVAFTYRTDLILNAPDFIKRVFYSWEQVPG